MVSVDYNTNNFQIPNEIILDAISSLVSTIMNLTEQNVGADTVLKKKILKHVPLTADTKTQF